MQWVVEAPDAISRCAREWDRLVSTEGYPACLAARFIAAVCTAFGTGNEKLALGFEGDRLMIGAVLTRIGAGRWATFQPSQLPLGAWVMAHSVRWDEGLASLTHALPGLTGMLTIMQQDTAVHVAPGDTARVHALKYIDTAWVDIDGSFDHFLEGRGKNLRQNLGKQRRRLERDECRLSFESAITPERVAVILGEYAALESGGWKAQGGTAISLDNLQGRFYSQLLESFAANGQALCLALRVNDVAVAVDLCVRDEGCVVILKTTYDESLKALSPGQLLHEEAFRHFFSQPDLRRVEFFGRVMEWHTRWTDKSRSLYHVNYYRWPPLHAAHETLRRLRDRMHA